MTRFRFRLEPVLEHRERQEDLAQQELAAAIAAVAAQQELAVAARRAVEAEMTRMRSLQSGGPVEIHELRLRHDALDRARRIAEHEAAGVDALEDVAAERRVHLVKAAQAVEALAKLKERHRGAHVAEAERRAAAEIDELALRRHRSTDPPGGAAA